MAEKIVTIAKFTDYSEADLAKQLLDDFGIESVVVGQNLANIWPEAPVFAEVELQTLEGQAQQALEILESQESQEKQEQ